MLGIKNGAIAAVAAAALATGTLSVPSAGASPVRTPAPVVHVQPVKAGQLHQALNEVRAQKPAWRNYSDTQLLTLFKSHIQEGSEAPAGTHGIRPMVSGWGTGTLWFSHTDVAWWATAGTAAVLALIVSLGVGSIPAWGIVFSLIGTFWAAWSAGYCAWFTYRSPRSWGTYRC